MLCEKANLIDMDLVLVLYLDHWYLLLRPLQLLLRILSWPLWRIAQAFFVSDELRRTLNVAILTIIHCKCFDCFVIQTDDFLDLDNFLNAVEGRELLPLPALLRLLLRMVAFR
jgi:hypothetical protein